jgi:wyosine [tRNA(Phe)-imidazoG37] synthetase (radical SAM superfamily)
MIVYGPVPSRRLGKSLGINNIPPKTCTYSCVYCQVGRTNHMKAERGEFYSPEEIFAQIKQKLRGMGDERVDYLSFVPDGEPTLDAGLGRHIDTIKPFGIKTAVITNASLLWMDDVKEDLLKADWVSIKIDAAADDIWKKVNRPYGSLELDRILQGAADFARRFKGELVTETMLVSGYNDDKAHLKNIADLIQRIRPSKAYILVPTRPPAETGVTRPSAEAMRDAYDIFSRRGIQTECVTGDEGDGFYFSSDIVSDLLSISSVHPVREDYLKGMLKKRNLDGSVIDRLVDRKLISTYIYEGKRFYKRNI